MAIPVSTSGSGTGTTTTTTIGPAPPGVSGPGNLGTGNAAIDTNYGAGWYGFKFADGVVAIVYVTAQGVIQWGKLKPPPNSLDFSYTYLASDRSHLFGYPPAQNRLNNFLTGIHAQAGASIISEIDHGVLGLKGDPIAIKPGGGVTWNTSPWTGSEAVATQIIPTPHISLPNIGGMFSFLDFLGNTDFWKGLGLILAGAAILVFAVLEFRKVT